MRILPLTPARPETAQASIRIRCCVCAIQEEYGKAAANGWTFDADGKSFEAYYCATHRPTEDDPVRVIFRKWPAKDGGDVVALFPDLPFDTAGRFCTSYQHIGQHGAADYAGVVRSTRPATADEYAPLLRELQQIGYTLIVGERR